MNIGASQFGQWHIGASQVMEEEAVAPPIAAPLVGAVMVVT